MPARGEDLAPLALADPTEVGVDPAVVREYEDTMKCMVRQGQIPGCASIVVRHGRIVHMGTYGYADIERKRPFGIDTLCRVFCTTKSYVVTAFMTLVDDGLAHLDDRVDKYLPTFANARVLLANTAESVEPKRPLLVKHLMTHSSGIGYAKDYKDAPWEGEISDSYTRLQEAMRSKRIASLRTFVDELGKVPLLSHPGDKYEYGYSIDVLARIVEVITGRDIEACLKLRVFDPLGMHDTKWCVDDADLDRLSACYASAASWGDTYGDKENVPISTPKNGLVRIDGMSPEESGWRRGQACKIKLGGGFLSRIAGGLVSTAADTVKFVMMLLQKGVSQGGQRVLKQKTVEMMAKNRKKPDWDAGINYFGFVEPRGDGLEYGMGGICSTYWSVDTSDDVGIVWFTQHADMPDYQDLKGVNPKRADIWETMHDAVESQRNKEREKEKRATAAKAAWLARKMALGAQAAQAAQAKGGDEAALPARREPLKAQSPLTAKAPKSPPLKAATVSPTRTPPRRRKHGKSSSPEHDRRRNHEKSKSPESESERRKCEKSKSPEKEGHGAAGGKQREKSPEKTPARSREATPPKTPKSGTKRKSNISTLGTPIMKSGRVSAPCS